MVDITVKNHYETLGVSPAAAVQAIRESYQRLSQSYAIEKLSGDIANVDSKIAAIDEAYSILTDSKARADYDKVYKIYISHQDSDLHGFKDPGLVGKLKKVFLQWSPRLGKPNEFLRHLSIRWIAVFCGVFLLFGGPLYLVYEGNKPSGSNNPKSTRTGETIQKSEDEIGAEGAPGEPELANDSGEKLVDSHDRDRDAASWEGGWDVDLNQRIAPRPEPKPKSAPTTSYDEKNVITNAGELSTDLLNFVRGQIQNRIPDHSYIEVTYENGNQGQGQVLWKIDDRHECSWPRDGFIERLEYYCLTFMDLSTDIIGFSLLYGPEQPTLIGETGYEVSGDILNFSSSTNFRVIEIR